MNHEPMPGLRERAWCPVCRAPSGPDCPARYRSKRATRRRDDAATRELAMHDGGCLVCDECDGDQDHNEAHDCNHDHTRREALADATAAPEESA